MRKKLMSCILLLLTMFCFLLPLQVHAAAAPAQPVLTGATSSAYNKIKISWKKVPNATKYYVYYKGEGENWKRVGSVDGSKTAFTHTASSTYPTETGRNYIYTVKAYSKDAGKYSTYDKAGIKAHTAPDKPVLKEIEMNIDYDTAEVTWNKTGGCTHYVVYRKSQSNPSWKKLATVKSSQTYYNDSSFPRGEKVTYTVKGYNSKYKVYGGYDSKGISVTTYRKSVTHYEYQLAAKGYTRQMVGFPRGTTFKTTNSKILKIVSTTGTSVKYKTVGTGTAEIVVTTGKQEAILKFTVMEPGDAFVKAWCKKEVHDMRLSTAANQTEENLLKLSAHVSGACTYGKASTLTDVIMERKGTCVTGGKLLVELCKAMGYNDATLRYAAKDKMSRYPSGIKFGSDHYNVKVVVGKNVYYIDGTPGTGFVYMSNETKPLHLLMLSFDGWYEVM